ncbi:helix-turn-helix transcriptional regulator [Pseudonocardia sp. WMMC193]|uniref:ArsR/SmtB family transcription factor n=1 Tax=Pseudonocardia sp. WMMC193 TaxID=2911965 RepID=UPI002104991E|nr:metalloregulator ArsR/SmtB family transcription factor [Pseudonocardia sp. WMMC193]
MAEIDPVSETEVGAPRAGADVPRVTVAPLYRVKAEFFKTLGHPVRIRVLELLSLRDHAVAEMLKVIDTEPASLSQQLAVLRRSGLVRANREGSTVVYSLAHPQVEQLLDVARSILTGVLAGQVELLDDLRGRPPVADRVRATED